MPLSRPPWPPSRSPPPAGVAWADWERVLAARRAEADRPVEDVRRLGPTLATDEVLVTVDEVLTPTPQPHHVWELRTATLVTVAGSRDLSGGGEVFLHQVEAAIRLAVGTDRSLLTLCDGARWIRTCFTQRLADLPPVTLLLDWHHRAHKFGSSPAGGARAGRRSGPSCGVYCGDSGRAR
jgi:hypothetical protein